MRADRIRASAATSVPRRSRHCCRLLPRAPPLLPPPPPSPPLLPEFPVRSWPSPELAQWVVPEVLVQDPVGAGASLAEGTSGSDLVPALVTTCADVATEPPVGHQATNQPSATVETTCWPSSSARVTPVTPFATRPSTKV